MTERELSGRLEDYEARLEEAKQRHSRAYRDMSYMPPKVPKAPKVGVEWSDVRPNREDIDSWATRMGATVIFSELLANKEVMPDGTHAKLAVDVTAIILGISALVPISKAFNKTWIDGASHYNGKLFFAQACYVFVLMASMAALWPGIIPWINRLFTDVAFQTKVFLVSFVAAIAIGLNERRKRINRTEEATSCESPT